MRKAIPTDDGFDIQENGKIVGTLTMDDKGVTYSQPNMPDRFLSWDTQIKNKKNEA